MANLRAPVNIVPNGNTWVEQLNFATFNTAIGGNTKVDIKTSFNNAQNGGFIMARIEAVGFAFGSSQAIRCAWCFHVGGNGVLYSVGLQSVYPGLIPTAVYIGVNGNLCLRGDMTSYYSGFTLNATIAQEGWGNVPITAPQIIAHSDSWYKY